MNYFTAKIFKIGINPCVIVPSSVLKQLFSQAGKLKGPIPVRGKLNGATYLQTVVKYSGKWWFYINGIMLRDAGLKSGDIAEVEIEFNPVPRLIPMHPKLERAWKQNKNAKATFDQLSPYRQKEIVRYISHLKSEESVDRNILKVIQHLSGKGSFAGRE